MGNAVFTNDLSRLTTDSNEDLARLKVQSIQIGQSLILRGFGYYFEWRTPALAVGAKAYVRVIVPAGHWMLIDYREVISNKEEVFYKVYVPGQYVVNTVGAVIPLRNLRNDSASNTTACRVVTLTTPPTTDSQIITVPVFGAVGAGNRESGEVSNDNIFRALGPGSEFLLEISNNSLEASYIQVNLVVGLLPEALIEPTLNPII